MNDRILLSFAKIKLSVEILNKLLWLRCAVHIWFATDALEWALLHRSWWLLPAAPGRICPPAGPLRCSAPRLALQQFQFEWLWVRIRRVLDLLPSATQYHSWMNDWNYFISYATRNCSPKIVNKMKADQGNEFLLYHLEEMVLGGSYPLENPLHSESYLETMKLIAKR